MKIKHLLTLALATTVQAQEAPTPDTYKPDVSIRRLATDATVGGTLTIEVSAQDATAITTVSAKAGTVDLGIRTGSPAVFRLDTTPIPNGKLEIVATAADSAGNVGTKKLRVRVDNGPAPHPQGPAVSLEPKTGTEVKGVVKIVASVTPGNEIRSVKAYAGKKAIGTATKPPYEFTLDTSWMEEQDLTVRVQALDAGGRLGRGIVTLHVNNPDTRAPTAELESPKAGATVSGVVWVEGRAKDDREVKETVLLADGKPVATRASGHFGCPWDTNALPPGKHALELKAVDMGGNEFVTPVTEVEVVPYPAAIRITGPAEGSRVDRAAKFLNVEWAAEKGDGFERVDLVLDGRVVAGRAHTTAASKGKMVLRMIHVPAGSFEVSLRARRRSQRFVESGKLKLSGDQAAATAAPREVQ